MSKKLPYNVKERRELARCIYNPADNINWPGNPKDPYIYISFSKMQYLISYAHKYKRISPVPHDILLLSENFSPEVIGKFKKIINTEWIKRAKIPIKYLPAEETSDSILKKQVVFILSNSLSPEEESAANNNKVVHTEFSYQNKGFSVITFQKVSSTADITPKIIYFLLHELGHALIRLQHFRPYSELDYALTGRFCRGKEHNEKSLDCTRTVMAYMEDCYPVIQKGQELLEGKEVSIFDKNPEIQQKLKQVFSAFPTQLGDVDLEAARQFRHQWEEKNKAMNPPKEKEPSNKNKPRVDLGIYTTTFGKNITQPVSFFLFKATDYLVTRITEGCLQLGSTFQACEHYFPKLPPGAPSHYSTNHLLFFNTAGAAQERYNTSYVTLNTAIHQPEISSTADMQCR